MLAAAFGCARGPTTDALSDEETWDRRAAVVVQVDQPDGTPLAGAPVAFYDAQQRLVVEIRTNAGGRAYGHLGGERGAVSVGRVLPSGEREMTTFVDVRRFDRLTVRTPAPDPPGGDDERAAGRLGDETRVTFPAPVEGAARYAVVTACGEAAADAGGESPTVVVAHPEYCARAGRELTFLGAALDAEGRPLVFASAKAALGAGAVELGAYEPSEEIVLGPSADPGAGAYFSATVTLRAGEDAIRAPFWRSQQWIEGPIPTSVGFRVPASMREAMEYRVGLETGSSDETYAGWYFFDIVTSWQQTGSADHASALPAVLLPLVDRVSIDRSGDAPVVEWHSVAPLDEIDIGRVTVDWTDDTGFFVWNLVTRGAVPPTRIAPPAPSPSLREFGLSATARWLELRWLTFEVSGPGGVWVTKWDRDSV